MRFQVFNGCLNAHIVVSELYNKSTLGIICVCIKFSTVSVVVMIIPNYVDSLLITINSIFNIEYSDDCTTAFESI